jgi:hypothetical protein
MSSVQEPHLHLEVGHILFLDIVGYSKLLSDEQKELVQELNQIVRETEQFRAAEGAGVHGGCIKLAKLQGSRDAGFETRWPNPNRRGGPAI